MVGQSCSHDIHRDDARQKYRQQRFQLQTGYKCSDKQRVHLEGWLQHVNHRIRESADKIRINWSWFIHYLSHIQVHRQCDTTKYLQFVWILPGHQTISKKHVKSLQAFLWSCMMLSSSSVCLQKGMCHLYVHLCATLLVTMTPKVWPLSSDFIYKHSNI